MIHIWNRKTRYLKQWKLMFRKKAEHAKGERRSFPHSERGGYFLFFFNRKFPTMLCAYFNINIIDFYLGVILFI